MRFGDRLRVDVVDAHLVDLLDVQHKVTPLLEHLAALGAPQRLRPRCLPRRHRALPSRLPLLLDGGHGGGVALLGEVDRLRLREEVAELVHVYRLEFARLSGLRRFPRCELGLCYRCLGGKVKDIIHESRFEVDF